MRGDGVKRTDEQRLKLFVEVVNACVASRAVQQGLYSKSFNMSFNADEGGLTQRNERDDELMGNFYIDFRKLVAKHEEALANQHEEKEGIFQICQRSLTDTELAEATDANLALWTTYAAAGGGMGFSVDGSESKSGLKLVRWYLNKMKFHDDIRGEKWKAPILQPALLFNVDTTAMYLLDVARHQAHLIKTGFERKSFDFKKGAIDA